jgi:hypothetical protein
MRFQQATQKPTRYMITKAKELIARNVTEADYVAKYRRGFKTAARKAYRIAAKEQR